MKLFMRNSMPLLKTGARVVGISIFLSAQADAQPSPDNRVWSAMNPLSVPLPVRQTEFKKGNIVPNASFEEGTPGKNDSAINNFTLPGWEKVGKNVEWVNTASAFYSSNEAHAGKHAIKICRKSEDVKEINNQSEGIESDFIKVIPGNYSFFYETRLDSVFPAVERYEVKISRDIDVHLRFFDKNKKELSPGIYYHRFGKEVDNSYKGYAFSNFFYIDKFKWGKVLARTYNNNFSEGDMPDGCAYVKMFFGLKGRGTMYVDNIDFRFSRWNFTTLERLTPIFAQEYTKARMILPTPKKVTEGAPVDFGKKTVTIVVPENAGPSDLAAADLLKQRVARTGKNTNKILVVKGDHVPAGRGAIIFSIGNNALTGRYLGQIDMSAIAGKDQGYIIKRVGKAGGPTVICLVGATPVGSYYAATTAVQLFDDLRPVYHHADIVDYPDFTGRSYRLKTFNNRWTLDHDTSLSAAAKEQKLRDLQTEVDYAVSSVGSLAFYKLNKIYNDYWSLSKRWWDPGPYFNSLYARLDTACSRLGSISPAIQINPYYHFTYESREESLSDSLRSLFSHSNPQDIQKIKNVLKGCIDRGARSVMVCADDFVPHAGAARGEYALFTAADKKAYFNMANAQVSMMNELRRWLDANYKGIRLEFVPAPYLNEFIDYGRGSAEAFFRDLTSHLSKDIHIVWTGNTVRSLVYDRADIQRYTEQIKSKPMIWDNTPYARDIAFPSYYAGKAVMCNLFEPYDIVVPRDFYKVMDSDIYINGNGDEERYNIKYATYADFTWNNNDYDPDFSLFKALVLNFGRRAAMQLLQFNDLYYQLVSKHSGIRIGMERASKEHPYVISDEDITAGAAIEKRLRGQYGELTRLVTNKRLLEQLKAMMEKNIQDFHLILKNNKGYLVGEYFLQR